MPHRNNKIAIRYYPADGETVHGNPAPASSSEGFIGVSTWLRDSNDTQTPTMLDSDGNPFNETSEYWAENSTGRHDVIFFDGAGLVQGQYVEKFVILTSSDGQPILSLDSLGSEVDLYVAGISRDYNRDTFFWDAYEYNWRVCGAFEFGVYTDGVYEKGGVLHVTSSYHRYVEGNDLSASGIPEPSNTWGTQVEVDTWYTLEFFVEPKVRLRGPEIVDWPPPPILPPEFTYPPDPPDDFTHTPTDYEGLVLRFYPVNQFEFNRVDGMAFFGAALWAMDEDDEYEGKRTMLSVDGPAEEILTPVYEILDNSYYDVRLANAFMLTGNPTYYSGYDELPILLTEEGSEDSPAQIKFPVDVYIVGLGSSRDFYGQKYPYVFDEENKAWIKEGSFDAGVLQIGLYLDGNYHALASLRFMGEYSELRENGQSWSPDYLPLPTDNVWLEDVTGILKATLSLGETSEVNFWTDFSGTEEIV